MEELLTRGVEEIISAAELEKMLGSGRKLRLKLGVDPSTPDIHLGHAVVLRKLRQFQDLGHTVIFLIGDATARIGDPSGRNQTRPVLSRKEIDDNAQTYLDQVGKLLDLSKCEARRNSEWLDQLDLNELLKLVAKFTVSQLIEREDFKSRLDQGLELDLHEILYPVMQAYDSVMLKADVEFGGSDQRFNMLAGRALQKKMGQNPQQVFMTKLIIGTDGKRKMSKSYGNYVALNDPPNEMFGKIMSLPDALIAEYYELCTNVDSKAIEELVKTIAEGANPRDAKASLAREIVGIYHGSDAALRAEESFNRQFRDKERPTDIPVERLRAGDPMKLSDLLIKSGLVTTRSDARRLIQQKGVKLNDEVMLEDRDLAAKSGDVIQVGKRRFVRLEVE